MIPVNSVVDNALSSNLFKDEIAFYSLLFNLLTFPLLHCGSARCV